MAAPPALRNSTNELLGFARRDLSALWRAVNDAPQARIALMDVLPALVETYGAAASTLAATWYDDVRDNAGAPKRFTAIPVAPSDRGAQALAGWATSHATGMASLEALVLGGIQRRIADHMRDTITGSSIADPSAKGWVRVGSGECDWCRSYLDGEVHYVEGYDFNAHDNCNCQAVPAF